MKFHLTFLLVITQLFSVKIFADNNDNNKTEVKKNGLEISFLLSEKEQAISNYKIYIYKDGQLHDSLDVTRRMPVYILLDFNSYYCLRIVKPGYKARMVLVDTTVPLDTQTVFQFDFEIEMLRKNAASNTLDDFPVALVHFNSEKKSFLYSEQYGTSICHMPSEKRSRR